MSDGRKPKRPPLPSRLKKRNSSTPAASNFSISFSARADNDSSDGSDTLGISGGASAAIASKKPAAATGDAIEARFVPTEQLGSSRVATSQQTGPVHEAERPRPGISAPAATSLPAVVHSAERDAGYAQPKKRPPVPSGSPGLRKLAESKLQRAEPSKPAPAASEPAPAASEPARAAKPSGASPARPPALRTSPLSVVTTDSAPAAVPERPASSASVVMSDAEQSPVDEEAAAILSLIDTLGKERDGAGRVKSKRKRASKASSTSSSAHNGSTLTAPLSATASLDDDSFSSATADPVRSDADNDPDASAFVDAAGTGAERTVSDTATVSTRSSSATTTAGDGHPESDLRRRRRQHDNDDSNTLTTDDVAGNATAAVATPPHRTIYGDELNNNSGDDDDGLFQSSVPSSPGGGGGSRRGKAANNLLTAGDEDDETVKGLSRSLPLSFTTAAAAVDAATATTADASGSGGKGKGKGERDWHPLMTSSTTSSTADTPAQEQAQRAAAADDEKPHRVVSSADPVDSAHCRQRFPAATNATTTAAARTEDSTTTTTSSNSPVRPFSPGGFPIAPARPVSSLSMASSGGGITSATTTATESSERSLPSSPPRDARSVAFATATESSSSVGEQRALETDEYRRRHRDNDLLAVVLPIAGSPTFRKHVFFGSVLFVLLSVGLSSFLLGLLFGASVMTLGGCLLLQWLVRVSWADGVREDAGDVDGDDDAVVGFHCTPPTLNKERRVRELLPHLQPPDVIEDAWSLTYNYEGPATHHPNRTTKVHLRLEGAVLTISTVREDTMSWKKNESSDDDSESESYRRPRRALFAHSRTVHLQNSVVRLVPDNLNKRQRWSKKFPIRLTLSPSDQPAREARPSSRAGRGGGNKSSMGQTTASSNPYENTVFFLFAGRSRDKMDWFMRMEMAADPAKASPRLCNLPEEYADYLGYTAYLLPDLVLPELETDSNKETPRKKASRASANTTPGRKHEFSPSLSRRLPHSGSNASIGSSTAGMGSVPPSSITSAEQSPRGSCVASPDRASLHANSNSESPLSASARGKDNSESTSTTSPTPSLPGRRAVAPQQHRPASVTSPFGSLQWFNAGLGRLFYDAWREPRWADKLKVRWQRKLSRIKLPPFLRTLVMKDLNLGHNLPVIQRVYQPQVDGRGLWLDILLTYKGSFQVSIGSGLDLTSPPEPAPALMSENADDVTTTAVASSEPRPSTAAAAAATGSVTTQDGLARKDLDPRGSSDSPFSPPRGPGDSARRSPTKARRRLDLSPAVAASLERRRRRRMRRRRTLQDSDKSDIDSGDDDESASLIGELAKKLVVTAHPSPPLQRASLSLTVPTSPSNSSMNNLAFSSVTMTPTEPPSPTADTPLAEEDTMIVETHEPIADCDEEAADASDCPAAAVPEAADESSSAPDPDPEQSKTFSSLMKSIVQSVLQSAIVERMKEKVSAVPVGLLVNVEAFEGIITVNVPPPPTSAIWFGFRYEPELKISAIPFIGEHQVKISQLSKLIEDKITEEVMKRLVLPNMEDLVIPLLSSGMEEDGPVAAAPSPVPSPSPTDLQNQASESKAMLI